MRPFLIAPSILSANFAHLGDDVKAVLAAGADVVHFDVMDNHYVPNLTIGPMVCQALRDDGITAEIDVHLMVKPVDAIASQFAQAGASIITFHPEASEHIDRTLQLIRSAGCKAGLVFNPATPLHYLDYVMDKLDVILIMSVNPGFGGQSFIPSTLDKLRQVRSRIDACGYAIRLAVDGGVKVDNIVEIANAGADMFVAGSAIFGQADYKVVVNKMRTELAKCEVTPALTQWDAIKAIAFDLDGTLVDSVPDLYVATQASLAELGLSDCTENQVRSWVGNGAEMLMRRAMTHALGQDVDQSALDAAMPVFMRHYQANLEKHSVLYADVHHVLSALHEAGYQLAVVTNKPLRFALPLLKAFGIAELFSQVLGGDSLAKMKPDPLPLQHLLTEWQLDATQLLMVGDSKNDILAAKAAGVASIGLTYGYNYGEDIGLNHPDAVCDQFKEVLNCFNFLKK